MGFRSLPRVVQILIVGMCLAGAAATAWGIIMPEIRRPVAAIVYLVSAFLIAAKRVPLHPRVATLSVGFVLVLASIFTCGTGVAMAVAAVNMLACVVFPGKTTRRPPLWVASYNASALAIAALAASRVYETLLGETVPRQLSWQWAGAAGAAVAVYYVASVLAVGVASTLHHLQLPPKRWWHELAATAPGFLAGGAIALAMDAGYHYVGDWMFVIGVPFAIVLHRSFATQAAKLQEEIEKREATERLAKVYFSVVKALSKAIDVKDHSTHQHVQRVHALARAVAQRMGLTGVDLEAVEFGAVLHDIGKIAIPDRILLKPSRLTDAEFEVVRQHPLAGEAILKPVEFGSDVATIVRYHHERFDGKGYPDGLAGDQIPIGARILAAIDVYDALVEERPYRKAWSHEQALDYLRQHAGTAFDPRVVEALADALSAGELCCAPESAPYDRSSFVDLGGVGWEPDLIDPYQVAAVVRERVLRALVDELDFLYPCLAWVVFVPQRSTGDMDAVAAAGECAPVFERLRIPLGAGPSASAALFGHVVTDAAASRDFDCLPQGAPPLLLDSRVVALPVFGPNNDPILVVSCYTRPDQEIPLTTLERAEALISFAVRQLSEDRGQTAWELPTASLDSAISGSL